MIQLTDVYKTFAGRNEDVKALKNINLSIKKSETFGVVGESGAGKSTLLRLINALESPSSGQIHVNEKVVNHLSKNDLRMHQKSVGMIFQQFNLLNNKTVEENITLPLTLHHYDNPLSIDEVLLFVGLEDKRNSYPSQLSGGQKQRVGIARALISRPSILLCDEPTSALDDNTTEEIVQVLKKAHEEFNMTIIVVTHELPVIKALCTRAAIMQKGKILDVTKVKNTMNQKESKPYYERALEVLKN